MDVAPGMKAPTPVVGPDDDATTTAAASPPALVVGTGCRRRVVHGLPLVDDIIGIDDNGVVEQELYG